MSRAFCPPRTVAEQERLQLLYRGGVLDMAGHGQLQALVGLARYLTGAEAARLCVLDDDAAVVLASSGGGPDVLPRTGSAAGVVVETAAPLLVHDLRDSPADSPLHALAQQGHRSCVAVPLTEPSGAVLGAVTALHGEPGAFDADGVDVLGRIARQVWVVLAVRPAESAVGTGQPRSA